MWTKTNHESLSSTEQWDRTVANLGQLLAADDHQITVLANAAAFLFETMPRLNWAGFYLFDGSRLVLGPFCGKPACTAIGMGKGVCGTAAETRQTIVVPNVDAFPGHIACDGASRSEIVLPMVDVQVKLIGVLDLDSPDLDRFTEADRAGLERVRDIIVERLADRPILAF